MNNNDITKFQTEFERILRSKVPQDKKDIRLSKLMTKMEKTFKIPALRSVEFEQTNNSVMRLYQQISFARKEV